MSKKNFIRLCCGLLFTFFVGLFTLNGNVYAAADYDTLMDKWMTTQYRTCIFDSGLFNTTVNVTNDNGKLLGNSVVSSVFRDGGTMYLPSYSLAGRDYLNCRGIASGSSLTRGKSVWDVNYPNIGYSRWNDGGGDALSEKEKFMTEKLGYKGESTRGDAYFTVQASRESVWEYCIGTIIGKKCFPVEGKEKEVSTPVVSITNNNVSVSGWDNLWSNLEFRTLDNNQVMVRLNNSVMNVLGVPCDLLSGVMDRETCAGLVGFSVVKPTEPQTVIVSFDPNTEKPEVLYNRLREKLNAITWELSAKADRNVFDGTAYIEVGVTYTYTFGIGELQLIDSVNFDKYTFGGNQAASIASVTNGKYADNGAMMFDNTDKYNLYSYYLQNAVSGITCSPSDKTGLTGIKLYTTSGFKDCYANLSSIDTGNLMVYTQTNNNGIPKIAQISLSTIISWLNGVDTSTIDTNRIDAIETIEDRPTPTPGGGTTDNSIVDCDSIKTEDGSKVGAMKWLLCPTANNLQYTANVVDKMTEEMLEISEDRYSTDSPTYTAWSYMRNIANVLMIIFLSVIIFSQITGYGIDNYGIKKMLPRLIVMALIVNVSFYICELAIDLSNIAGVGLRNMFGSIGNELAGGQLNGANFMKTMFVGLFTAIGTGGSAAVSAGMAVATVTSASLLIPAIIAVIVLVLVVLVAIMIMFLMLGARNIIVIVCVALSPLAFATFVLPNTQNIFKKWWDLFKAAIIIFPICGAMSGISNMLRGMSFENNGGGLITHAMNGAQFAIMFLLPYLSFFLLPMLLKNAISALGKVGGALTAMGQSVRNSGRAIGQNAMRLGQSSDWYKNRQQESARRQQEQIANRILRRYGDGSNLQTRLNEAKRRMEANPSDRGARREYERALTDQRRAARASETLRKLGNEDMAAGTILTERQYADTSEMELRKMWREAADSGDVDRRVALENVITSRFGAGGVNGIVSEIASMRFFDDNGEFIGGNDGAMAKTFRSLQSNMIQNTSFGNNMRTKASDASQMISGGGYGSDGVRHNLDYHSAHNNIATKDEDWVASSAATLRRAIDAGQLTQADCERILNSDVPAVRSGLSDQGKLAVLQAGAAGYKSSYHGDWDRDSFVDQSGKKVKTADTYTDLHNINRKHAEQAELDVRNADRELRREMARNIEEMNNRQKGGGDNNGGQGFNQGAGI